MNPQPVAAADCRERAVLVAVIRDNQDPRQTEEFLDELEFLAETADICSVKRSPSGCRSLRRASTSVPANWRRSPRIAGSMKSTW